MGVGKTAVSRELKKLLPNAVFLDGDWCWDMDPFVVNGETKAMVMDNIRHLLRNFLRCSTINNVVFCWVMHEQQIIDDVLEGLPACHVERISLTCTPEELERRLEGDIAAGIRQRDIIGRSLPRLKLYETLDTRKIDTTGLTPCEVAALVAKK